MPSTTKEKTTQCVQNIIQAKQRCDIEYVKHLRHLVPLPTVDIAGCHPISGYTAEKIHHILTPI